MEFECHDCGNDQFEEILQNCIVATEMWVDNLGYVQYGDQETTYGEVARYQCSLCGHNIEYDGDVVTSREELVEYLTNLPINS